MPDGDAQQATSGEQFSHQDLADLIAIRDHLRKANDPRAERVHSLIQSSLPPISPEPPEKPPAAPATGFMSGFSGRVPPEQQRGVMAGLGRLAAIPGQMVEAAAAPARPEEAGVAAMGGQPALAAKRMLIDPFLSETEKAADPRLGRSARLGHFAAAALPVVGPWAASMGERAVEDPWGVGTELVGGTLGAELGPEAMRLAQERGPAAARLAARGTGAAISKVGRGLGKDVMPIKLGKIPVGTNVGGVLGGVAGYGIGHLLEHPIVGTEAGVVAGSVAGPLMERAGSRLSRLGRPAPTPAPPPLTVESEILPPTTKALPAVGEAGGPIITPPPTPEETPIQVTEAPRGVARDPQTGRMKRYYMGEKAPEAPPPARGAEVAVTQRPPSPEPAPEAKPEPGAEAPQPPLTEPLTKEAPVRETEAVKEPWVKARELQERLQRETGGPSFEEVEAQRRAEETGAVPPPTREALLGRLPEAARGPAKELSRLWGEESGELRLGRRPAAGKSLEEQHIEKKWGGPVPMDDFLIAKEAGGVGSELRRLVTEETGELKLGRPKLGRQPAPKPPEDPESYIAKRYGAPTDLASFERPPVKGFIRQDGKVIGHEGPTAQHRNMVAMAYGIKDPTFQELTDSQSRYLKETGNLRLTTTPGTGELGIEARQELTPQQRRAIGDYQKAHPDSPIHWDFLDDKGKASSGKGSLADFQRAHDKAYGAPAEPKVAEGPVDITKRPVTRESYKGGRYEEPEIDRVSEYMESPTPGRDFGRRRLTQDVYLYRGTAPEIAERAKSEGLLPSTPGDITPEDIKDMKASGAFPSKGTVKDLTGVYLAPREIAKDYAKGEMGFGDLRIAEPKPGGSLLRVKLPRGTVIIEDPHQLGESYFVKEAIPASNIEDVSHLLGKGSKQAPKAAGVTTPEEQYIAKKWGGPKNITDLGDEPFGFINKDGKVIGHQGDEHDAMALESFEKTDPKYHGPGPKGDEETPLSELSRITGLIRLVHDPEAAATVELHGEPTSKQIQAVAALAKQKQGMVVWDLYKEGKFSGEGSGTIGAFQRAVEKTYGSEEKPMGIRPPKIPESIAEKAEVVSPKAIKPAPRSIKSPDHFLKDGIYTGAEHSAVQAGAEALHKAGLDERLIYHKVGVKIVPELSKVRKAAGTYNGSDHEIKLVSPDDPEVFLHEYGHHLDTMWREKGPGWYHGQVTVDYPSLREDRQKMMKEYRAARDEAAENMGLTGREAKTWDYKHRMSEDHPNAEDNEIALDEVEGSPSPYAMSNPEEWFAESFEHYMRSERGRLRLKGIAPGTYKFIDKLVRGGYFK